ncbi:MAG: HD domain-containing protein [Pseudomonadota bacterium]
MDRLDAIDNADALLQVLVERGQGQYGYERVSQLEHALQCAQLAEAAGEPPALIVAALFHDVGHLVDGADVTWLERGRDDRHELRAVQRLRRSFGAAVVGPIVRHVAAKRYLCATESGYLEALSEASRASLALQGGPMTPAEAQRFRRQAHAAEAIRLRRYDDAAKLPGRSTPPAEYFARYWRNGIG